MSTNPNPSATNKQDGLIRMLLQSATPTQTGPNAAGSTPPQPRLPTAPSFSPPAQPVRGSGPRMQAPIRIIPPTAPPPIVHHHIVDDLEAKSNSYINQISGNERELNVVMLDHSYALPWHLKPDPTSVIPTIPSSRPTKTIFVPRIPRYNQHHHSNKAVSNEHIEVVGEADSGKRRPYNKEKAANLMTECERFASFANPDVMDLEDAEEWEERISR